MFEEQLWEKDKKLQTYTNRWEEFVAPEPPIPPLPPLENVIHHPAEDSVLLFNTTGEGNFIEMYVRYDEGTDESEVFVVPNGIFADERYIKGGDNIWELLFKDLGVEQVNLIIAKPRWFPEEVFLALNALYENPSAETARHAFDELDNRYVVDTVKISNKAFQVEIEDNPGVRMFLAPDLVNYLQISYDPAEEEPYLEYTGGGYFDIDAGFAEAVSYLMDAFDAIPDNIERADRNILDFANLGDGDTGGTIQPECMRLVQALFDNPTEDNRDSLITYLSQFDDEYTGDPLISDDEAPEVIETDLATLDAAGLLAKIQDEAEFNIVINQHTYKFETTSESAADVKVDIKGLYYQTATAVEGEPLQIEVGEITLTEGGGR